MTNREHNFVIFWTELLSKAKSRELIVKDIKPAGRYYIGKCVNGMILNYVVRTKRSRPEASVEIYPVQSKSHQKACLNLMAHKKEINEVFGEGLVWQKLEKRKQKLLVYYSIKGVIFLEKERWPELQDKLLVAMGRLEKAFKLFIQ